MQLLTASVQHRAKWCASRSVGRVILRSANIMIDLSKVQGANNELVKQFCFVCHFSVAILIIGTPPPQALAVKRWFV